MKDIDFAYLAGYLDGDGCFYVGTTIQKPKNILVFEYSIQVSSTDQFILQYFKNKFHGSLRIRPEKKAFRKTQWAWTSKNIDSLEIATGTFHFLVSKKNICNLFIKLCKSIKPNFGISIDTETIEYRKNIIKQIKEEIHMSDRVNRDLFNQLKLLEQTIEPSQQDLAYFAGLIDSEGCFRICSFQSKRKGRSKSYIPVLEIGNTKYSIFPWLMQRFGGTVVYREPTSRKQNPMIIWSLRANKLAKIIDNVFPYLMGKKARCEKIKELIETKMPLGNRKNQAFKDALQQTNLLREAIFNDLHTLNAKGKH